MSEYQHSLPLQVSEPDPKALNQEREPIDWAVIKAIFPAIITGFAALAFLGFIAAPTLFGVHGNDLSFADNLQFALFAACLLCALYLALAERYYLFSGWILFIYLSLLAWF